MKKSAILLTLLAFSACSVKLIAPAQTDVDRVSAKYPNYTLADLNAGQDLYEHTCNRCHRLKNPRSRNEEKWTKIVPAMIARLNKKEKREVVDAHQQELILRYVVTMNSAPKP
jgi:cytochrome c5